MTTIKSSKKMLAVRAPRESCLAFYTKFKKIDVTYLAGTNLNFKPSINVSKKYFKYVGSSFYPKSKGIVTNLSLVGIKKLKELVKETDIVNLTDTYYSFNAEAVYYAKKYNKKIVTIIWATIPNHLSSWLPPYSFFTRMVINNTDLFILRNKTAYRFTDSLGIDRKKIKLIYKGVDLDHFYPNRKAENLMHIAILYVGIYHPSKGLYELIEAFEKLIKSGFAVTLHFAGRGKLNDYINKKALNLPIINHGFVSYSNLANLYRTADIFCSPSKEIRYFGLKIWEEYFSYTLMEAQASGLPIVTTKSGGIPEEVDSRNPIVEIGNANKLYKALEKLVTDPKLRQDLSKINRKRAEKYFDASRQAKKTEEAILNLISVHR